MIYLAEITAYDPSIPGEKVLRYATEGFVTGAAEVPANTWYEPRIQNPALMRRDAFAEGTTQGPSTVGYGELVLLNNDGGLDALMNYAFDARQIVLRVGDPGAAYPGGFTTVLTGTIEQATFEWARVSIRLRDLQAELDLPIQTTLYAGNNALPAGLEGVAGDLLGKPKPRVYGNALNVQPPCCNTSRLIYQVNDGAVASVDAVYDRAVALTPGAAYVSQVDMETNAPVAGAFRAWPAGAYFRLGSSPAGTITADVTQGATAADRTTAQIAKGIATGPGAIAAGAVVAADVTALDAADSAICGLWIPDPVTMRAVLDQVLGGAGAWWGFDRLGQLRMQRLELPSGTPVATLTGVEMISLEHVISSDPTLGIPAWRSVVSYARNFTVQTTDVAGAVTDARRAWLRDIWRQTVSEDATVKTAHPLATEDSVESLFVAAADAQTEGDRRLALRKVRRDFFKLSVRLDATLAAAIDLGVVVELQHARFGLSGGKLFRVLGIQTDLRINALDLTVWG